MRGLGVFKTEGSQVIVFVGIYFIPSCIDESQPTGYLIYSHTGFAHVKIDAHERVLTFNERHAILEVLYDLPAGERTLDRAIELLAPQWSELVAERPEVVEMLADSGEDESDWLRGAGDLVEAYFGMEDPTRLEPAARELRVEAELPSGLVLRGFVDRLDEAATGQLRVVDYKTGKPPAVGFEARAMFQMRFYALALWRMRGEIPTVLQLMYLATGAVLRYQPDESDLLAMERKVDALWQAIQRAIESGDWRPNRSALCSWCAHQALCPAWGGTPPPLPVLEGPSPGYGA